MTPGNNFHDFDTARRNLRTKVKNDYNHAVREFKKIMANASRELWKCDAPKTARYENDRGNEFYISTPRTKKSTTQAVTKTSITRVARTKRSTTSSLFSSESCFSASVILSCTSLRLAPRAVLFFIRGVDIHLSKCLYGARHISSRGTKKSQFLNSDEEKPVSPEKSHSMGRFLACFGLYWLFFVWLF